MLSVVVPFNSVEPQRVRIWEWLRRRWAGLPAEVVSAVGDSGIEGDYSHAAGINAAAEQASGDVLLIVEADIALDPMWVLGAAVAVAEDPRKWVLAQRYNQLTEAATAKLLRRHPLFSIPDLDCVWTGDGVSWCGGIVLAREAFERVGGYDERFTGWGGDDVSFAMSLETLWGPHSRMEGDAWHLWHPRGGLDAQPQDQHDLMHRYLKAAGDRGAMREVRA